MLRDGWSYESAAWCQITVFLLEQILEQPKKKYPMKTERNICGKPNHTVLLVKIKITNYETYLYGKKIVISSSAG